MPVSAANRFTEMNDRSEKYASFVFSHFLDLNEQSVLSALHLDAVLFGGADGCERRMARFGDPELCGSDQRFPIQCVRIAPVSLKYAEDLTHRDCLGALMALGFERELLGDIVVRKEYMLLFCEEHIASYICDALHRIRNTAVKCSVTDDIPEGDLFTTKAMTVQVSSERLDAIIAHVWHFSRNSAQSLFPQGKVFVNGKSCADQSYIPQPGEIVSVRSAGRFRFEGITGKSAKGKQVITVSLFV